MRKVVVTGASSMIGTALIDVCIKEGVEVLAIVRKGSQHRNRLKKSDLVKICECDLDDLAAVREETEPYDVFYHMAWAHTLREQRDQPVLQEENIKYTLDAVNLAKRLGCRKFIGAGSQAEYGKVDTIITPDTTAKPLTAYGIAKYAAGMMSRKLCEQYGMIHIWGRIFSVYGRYDREDTMIYYAVERFLKGEPAKFSSGTQLWDYLHVEEAGKIFYLLGERVTENQVYCIADGRSRPLKEFILDIKDLCDPKAACEFSEATDDRNVISLQADIEGLVEDIGYRPQISFKKGMEDVIKDQKFHRLIEKF